MIEEAQEQKAPIERLLDGWAQVYTPVALVLAGLLWWWSGDALRAITVLIVFCPRVMVLDSPTAFVAAIGNAALRGSLVKKGATIESLAKIDTVAFDKTGTLTLGQPKVIAIHSLNGLVEGELLRLAAIAEKFSEHPVGRAIIHAASHSQSLPDPVLIQTGSRHSPDSAFTLKPAATKCSWDRHDCWQSGVYAFQMRSNPR